MPECYTHAYIASKALMRSGKVVASHSAFLAGANGPDSLYAFQAWKKIKKPDLSSLAKRMHQEKTGAFLLALVQLSMTPAQQSFTLGFLTHYAADCVMYPFVEAMSASDGVYSMPQGRNWLQASIDSSLYYKDYKTYTVPLHAGSPVIITDDLAQVTSILRDAILQVYGLSIANVALADMYHSNLAVRRFLISNSGVKKAWVGIMEHSLYGKSGRFKIRSRMQPAKPLKALPEKWKNPYTQEELNMTLEELVVLAEQAGASCIMAAMDFWLGNITLEQLSSVVGNNNYYTGLPLDAKEVANVASK